VVVRYVAPKQGAQLAFDMLAIPADAPHPENAERFIYGITADETESRQARTNQLS
jgi:spermidine/putrescine-binding protein